MTAGRKPKPVALKLIEGNRGKRRIPKTVTPPPELPAPPPGMRAAALEAWHVIVPQLDRLGLLTGLDWLALEGICECYANRSAARRLLDENGPMIGKVKNPAAQLFRDADTSLRAWLVEFGMTPSARARMVLPDEKDLDLERLLAAD